MPNYQNGKIYKIYSYENDDVYYGSTCEKLSRRMGHHRSHLKMYKEDNSKDYYTVFKILELTSAKIELVENYPCNTKEELLQREGYYIKTYNCVNKVIPCRTMKEYIEDHKEHLKETHKIWAEQNKDKLYEYNKQWREQNKEYIKEKQKENKEKIKEYLIKYNEQNKEKRKEYLIKYREANRDEIKRKQNERYKQKKEQLLMLKEDTNIKI